MFKIITRRAKKVMKILVAATYKIRCKPLMLKTVTVSVLVADTIRQ